MKLTEEDVQAYGEGLMRWIESDEISLDDLFEVKVYRLLACLLRDPRREVLDSNGMSSEELCRYLNVTNLDNELKENK